MTLLVPYAENDPLDHFGTRQGLTGRLLAPAQATRRPTDRDNVTQRISHHHPYLTTVGEY